MTFGIAHRILTSVVAALGVIALLGAAPLPDPTLGVVLIGLAAAIARPEAWAARAAKIHAGAMLTIALFAVEGARIIAGRTPIDAVVELLVGIQLVALATRRGASHDLAVLTLALLHFLAATAFGGGAAFAMAFAGGVVFLPATLVLSHLRREVETNYHQGARDRAGHPVDVPRILRSRRVIGRGFLGAMGSLALPIAGLVAGFFLFAPRLATHARVFDLDLHAGLVRFTDDVDLSQRGALRPDPSVAFRFRVDGLASPPPLLPLRFRATTLERTDGVSFHRARPAGDGAAPPAGLAIAIDQTGFEPRVVHVPPGAIVRGALGPEDRARHLALPANAERIRDLARAWTAGVDGAEAKARVIERRLKTTFAYDLASPSRGRTQPIDHFLFESRRGHCELFASTMAIMLRAVGVPSRVVLGFVGGTYNRFGGFYAVRQGDAHAWVEGYVDGWRTFDPTPAGDPPSRGIFALTRDLADAAAARWATSVVGFDRRAEAWAAARREIVVIVAFVLVVGLLFAAARGGRRARSLAIVRDVAAPLTASTRRAAALYATLERVLSRRGLARDPAVPPLAHAEGLVRSGHPIAGEVFTLTSVYIDARFGGQKLGERAIIDFERRVRALEAG
ncbi:MAG: transglutaminase domain-containing protein [Labilithrix sp.]|nr:transglutaminase domain-containing protein [Labilithrix sp.]